MHYLREYSRILALLAAKADCNAGMLLFLESAKSIVGGECAMHLQFCREWGMMVEADDAAVGLASLLEAHPASPTNMLYTSYMLRIGFDRPYYEGVAAVLPCAWIYNEVGHYLKSKGSPHPQYARWIETYGSEEFSATTKSLIEITTRFVVLCCVVLWCCAVVWVVAYTRVVGDGQGGGRPGRRTEAAYARVLRADLQVRVHVLGHGPLQAGVPHLTTFLDLAPPSHTPHHHAPHHNSQHTATARRLNKAYLLVVRYHDACRRSTMRACCSSSCGVRRKSSSRSAVWKLPGPSPSAMVRAPARSAA